MVLEEQVAEWKDKIEELQGAADAAFERVGAILELIQRKRTGDDPADAEWDDQVDNLGVIDRACELGSEIGMAAEEVYHAAKEVRDGTTTEFQEEEEVEEQWKRQKVAVDA